MVNPKLILSEIKLKFSQISCKTCLYRGRLFGKSSTLFPTFKPITPTLLHSVERVARHFQEPPSASGSSTHSNTSHCFCKCGKNRNVPQVPKHQIRDLLCRAHRIPFHLRQWTSFCLSFTCGEVWRQQDVCICAHVFTILKSMRYILEVTLI